MHAELSCVSKTFWHAGVQFRYHERLQKVETIINDRAKLKCVEPSGIWTLSHVFKICMKYKPQMRGASPKIENVSKLWFDKRQKQHTWL